MIIIGTYQIINTLDQKSYVGSSDNIAKRWKEHTRGLNNGALGKVNTKGKPIKHHNDHLQAAWIKYGADAFQFHIIEIADSPEQAIQDEQQLINALWDNGKTCYNTAKYATSGMKGRKHKQESKDKMSATREGIKLSPEQCAAISAGNTGKKHSPEQCAANSARQKGKKHSLEQCAANSARQKGRKHSEQHIRNQAAAHKGKKRSPEQCAANSARQKGKKGRPWTQEQKDARTGKKLKPRTQEQKDAMSALKKALYAKRRADAVILP